MRRISVAGRVGDGRQTVDALLSADQLVDAASVLAVLVAGVAAVLFLRWQLAVQRNLPALGGRASAPGPVGGVAAWLVPGVNLVWPFGVVARLWRAGEPGRPLPRLLAVWWAAWVVAALAVLGAQRLPGVAADVGERQRIDALHAAATLLAALFAALTIAVLAAVTARQDRRAAEVGAPLRPVGDRGRPAPPEGAASTLTVRTEEQVRKRT